jgi:hypothetical protein
MHVDSARTRTRYYRRIRLLIFLRTLPDREEPAASCRGLDCKSQSHRFDRLRNPGNANLPIGVPRTIATGRLGAFAIDQPRCSDMGNLDVFMFMQTQSVLLTRVRGVYNAVVKLNCLRQASFWRPRIRLLNLLTVVAPE